MYLQLLSDLPLDRLELAFQRGVLECKFMPTIAEIRSFETRIEISPERIEAAHQRLRARLAAQPEVKQLASVLDDRAPAPRREIRQLTAEEHEKRMKLLRAQLEQIKVTE